MVNKKLQLIVNLTEDLLNEDEDFDVGKFLGDMIIESINEESKRKGRKLKVNGKIRIEITFDTIKNDKKK